jgi:hypothetical protein
MITERLISQPPACGARDIVEIVLDLARQILARHPRGRRRIALATPLAFALPWLFTTMPLRPRKTAPLWLLGSRWGAAARLPGREISKQTFERMELGEGAAKEVGHEARGSFGGLTR